MGKGVQNYRAILLVLLLLSIGLLLFFIFNSTSKSTPTPTPTPTPAPTPAPAPGVPAPAPGTDYCLGMPLPPAGVLRQYTFDDPSGCEGSFRGTDIPVTFKDGFTDCSVTTDSSSVFRCLTDNTYETRLCDTANCGSPCTATQQIDLNKCVRTNNVYCTGTGTVETPQCTPYPPGRRPQPFKCSDAPNPPVNMAFDYQFSNNPNCVGEPDKVYSKPLVDGKSTCLNFAGGDGYFCIGGGGTSIKAYQCSPSSECASPCTETNDFPLNQCITYEPGYTGVACSAPGNIATSCVPFSK